MEEYPVVSDDEINLDELHEDAEIDDNKLAGSGWNDIDEVSKYAEGLFYNDHSCSMHFEDKSIPPPVTPNADVPPSKIANALVETESSDEDDSDDDILPIVINSRATVDNWCAEEEESAPSGPLRTFHEQVESEILGCADVTISPADDISCIGKVLYKIRDEGMVVIESQSTNTPLEERSLLCLENRKIVGKIHEVFGPVTTPYYIVRIPLHNSTTVTPQPSKHNNRNGHRNKNKSDNNNNQSESMFTATLEDPMTVTMTGSGDTEGQICDQGDGDEKNLDDSKVTSEYITPMDEDLADVKPSTTLSSPPRHPLPHQTEEEVIVAEEATGKPDLETVEEPEPVLESQLSPVRATTTPGFFPSETIPLLENSNNPLSLTEPSSTSLFSSVEATDRYNMDCDDVIQDAEVSVSKSKIEDSHIAETDGKEGSLSDVSISLAKPETTEPADDRFASLEELVPGVKIFYVKTFSSFVTPASLSQLARIKGSDASNIYDEEVPPEEQDFSDDEAEQRARKGKNQSQARKRELAGNEEEPEQMFAIPPGNNYSQTSHSNRGGRGRSQREGYRHNGGSSRESDYGRSVRGRGGQRVSGRARGQWPEPAAKSGHISYPIQNNTNQGYGYPNNFAHNQTFQPQPVFGSNQEYDAYHRQQYIGQQYYPQQMMHISPLGVSGSGLTSPAPLPWPGFELPSQPTAGAPSAQPRPPLPPAQIPQSAASLSLAAQFFPPNRVSDLGLYQMQTTAPTPSVSSHHQAGSPRPPAAPQSRGGR